MPSKCDLFKQQSNYLGNVVSKEGVSSDPEKIKEVTECPQPTTVTEVKVILGFVSYYRRLYTKLFQTSQTPQYVVTKLEGTSSQKKKFKVHWGPKQQKAFETLQRLCNESPILAYADFEAPFILHTDASGDGLGAVLYQVPEGAKVSHSICLSESV